MKDKKVLNDEQIQAIEYDNGPLLIIAGAGTGKTTVVTERINYLISSAKAKPQEILALTFTEKASQEMEERVDEALPYGMSQMWISTFHSFCDRILRTEGVHIGIDPGYQLMTEAETILFFRKHLFDFDLKYFRPLGNPNKFISAMIEHFSRLKDEDVSPQEYEDWIKKTENRKKRKEEALDQEKYQELARAYKTYEELKITKGVLDFSDLISFTLKIFRERTNILKQYQDQFRYILIDEFQDTNYAQNQLAILLTGERQNITVVGDDDQAIYRFRGAAISNMIQFRTYFPNTKTVVLTKNYRSTKEILDRSYDLIQYNNPDRLEMREHIDKKLQSMRRVKGEAIEVIIADRVENEADAVAKKILEIKRQMPEIQWSDVAILVRANAHANPFARAMEQAGIPFQFLGPGQLFRQPEIKDLIAYLKILYAFDDNIAMYRVLSMDWLGLSGRDIAALVNIAKQKGISLFEACESVSGEDEVSKKIQHIVSMIHRHMDAIRKETAGQILYYFLEETGMLRRLTTYESARDEKIAANIARFFDKLKTYEIEHGGDATVFAVVDWIHLSMELGESPLAADTDWTINNAVHILTVHSSKGLEFRVVFLVNLVSLRFPSMERKEKIPIPQELMKEILPKGDVHLQEERRLFYVAMTRARDRLIFTAAKYYGEAKREKRLSPFIVEAVGEQAVQNAQSNPVGATRQLSLLDDWSKNRLSGANDERSVKTQPISYISYSQLDTFMTCPLQYKYRYVVKIPVPASAALSFGDTLHQTMYAFYIKVREGKSPSFEDLLKIYEEKWVSRGYGNVLYENKMKTHGKALLKGFFEKGYDPNVLPHELEQPFRIKITPRVKLGGKIDRVDKRLDGKIEIIDYKTGQSTRMKDVKNDLQLSVYAMAATDQGVYSYRPEDVIVSFYFFEGQEKISATRTKKELEEAKENIATTVAEMEKSTYPANPGKHCDFCEFRLICEAWQ
jgi:DNA helicase-2/ATP-dependent DNA helicase PcrA